MGHAVAHPRESRHTLPQKAEVPVGSVGTATDSQAPTLSSQATLKFPRLMAVAESCRITTPSSERFTKANNYKHLPCFHWYPKGSINPVGQIKCKAWISVKSVKEFVVVFQLREIETR